MDKTRFTRDPHLDSEGFSATNPAGWQEVDDVALPSVWSWAEPLRVPYSPEGDHLRIPYDPTKVVHN